MDQAGRISTAMKTVSFCEHLINRYGTQNGWHVLAAKINSHYPDSVEAGSLCHAVTELVDLGFMDRRHIEPAKKAA